MEYLCHKWPLVVNTSRSFPRSWLMTGFVTKLTRRVPLVEQELLTLPENLSSLPLFSGVRDTWSLVLCVCFVDRCLYFCTFWPLCYLFFFDLRILISLLVSSSYSCRYVLFSPETQRIKLFMLMLSHLFLAYIEMFLQIYFRFIFVFL